MRSTMFYFQLWEEFIDWILALTEILQLIVSNMNAIVKWQIFQDLDLNPT